MAALAAPAARAGEIDPLLPADTESLVTINTRQIIDSELFKNHVLPVAKEALDGAGDVNDVLKDLGLDPFKDIDRLTFATPQSGDADRGLIILHGKFDLDKFHKRAEDALRENDDVLKKHKVPDGAGGSAVLYEVVIPGQPSLFVSLYDKTTILASPGKDYVVDAIKQGKAKKKAALKNKDFQVLLEKLDPRQSLSVAVLGSSLKGELLDSAGPAVKDVVDKIEAIGGGIALDKDVVLEVAVATKKEDDAKDMREAIAKGLKVGQAALALLGGEGKEVNLALEVLKTIKVTGKGKVVSIKGKIASDALEDALKKE
jgi:hypothetical protein